MTAISANKLDTYIQSLTSQISASVDKIKSERAGDFSAERISKQTDNTCRSAIGENAFAFGVSYLEPKMLSAVQHFVQEAGAGKMREDSARREQVEDGNAPKTKETENLSETERPDFAETLDSVFASDKTEQVRENFQMHGLSTEKTALSFFSAMEGIGADYVSSVYDYVFNLNNRPQIKIEFMHKYNRSFDYTI